MSRMGGPKGHVEAMGMIASAIFGDDGSGRMEKSSKYPVRRDLHTHRSRPDKVLGYIYASPHLDMLGA